MYIYMDVHLSPSERQCQHQHQCSWLWACIWVYMHVQVYVYGFERSTLGVIPQESSILCFKAGSLTGTRDSLGWLASESWGSSCLPLLSAGIKSTHYHIWLPHMGSGSTQLLRLQSIEFAYWVTSQNPPAYLNPCNPPSPLAGPFIFPGSFPPISFCLCLLKDSLNERKLDSWLSESWLIWLNRWPSFSSVFLPMARFVLNGWTIYHISHFSQPSAADGPLGWLKKLSLLNMGG